MMGFPLLILAALVSSAANGGERLQKVRDERLEYVLANVQIVKETSARESKALRVRILSVPEHGECDETPESCPKAELFVAVSGFDEYPDQRVYQLPRRHQWRFVRWDHFPTEDGPNDYVECTLEADDPIVQPADKWWRAVRYRLKVNYRDGRIFVQAG
jgi:hypothetical protein